MSRILVVGEDSLCCALGERLVQACLPRWKLPLPPIDTKGVTKLQAALPRYIEHATHVQPVLCVADTDGSCAAGLVQAWLPRKSCDRLLLRLAVTEAEGWALADASAFAGAFAVPLNKIPRSPDDIRDAKGTVLTLARRSKKRSIRDEVVSSADPSKPGAGYNLHLCSFVRNHWNVREAAQRSPSLQRAVQRLAALNT
jgi:hypothetical protein